MEKVTAYKVGARLFETEGKAIEHEREEELRRLFKQRTVPQIIEDIAKDCGLWEDLKAVMEG